MFLVACDKTTSVTPTPDPTPSPNPTSLNQVISGNTNFAVNIYREMVDETENQVISPYSISTALAMVYAGANDNTATEMQQVFGFGTNNSTFHQTYNQVKSTIESNINGANNNQISIVNKLWRDGSFTFLPDFESTMTTDYNAPVEVTNFAQATAAKNLINNWVDQQTNQLIPELLPDGFITPQTRSVLVNAIYFKADWAEQFMTHLTSPKAFKTTSSNVTTDMMSGLIATDNLKYTSDANAEILELEFEDEQSSMVFILPQDANLGINSFVQQHITNSNITQWLDDLDNYNAPAMSNFSLLIPKWKFGTAKSIVDHLQNMGLNDIFSPSAADLSLMTSLGAFVENIQHEAVIETHEGGVEAAAATAVGVGLTSVPPVVHSMNFDRPFVFLIKDAETKSILFIGHVQDPTQH